MIWEKNESMSYPQSPLAHLLWKMFLFIQNLYIQSKILKKAECIVRLKWLVPSGTHTNVCLIFSSMAALGHEEDI